MRCPPALGAEPDQRSEADHFVKHGTEPINKRTSRDSLMTIDMFAHRVGVTTRTVRSYHSRGILHPPHRVSRTPYYDETHFDRMQTVLLMQRNGLPLEAICALLNPDHVLGEFVIPTKQIALAVSATPGLHHTLTTSGVLRKLPDGGLKVTSMRAVVAARAAIPPELPISEALRLLSRVVVAVRPIAANIAGLVSSEAGQHVSRSRRWQADLGDFAAEVVRLSLQTLDPN